MSRHLNSSSSSTPVRAGLLLCALALAACGGGSAGGGEAFGLSFPDNDDTAISAAKSRLVSYTRQAGAPFAAGVAEDGQVFAIDLTSGQVAWQQPSEAKAAPFVVDDAVVLHEQRGVVIRDLATGAERVVVPDEAMHLAGADGADGRIVLGLSTGGGYGARSRLITVAGGSIDEELRIEQTLGAPAIGAGLLWVPWAAQNLSAIDVHTGAEVARMRMTDGIVGHARVDTGLCLFGQESAAAWETGGGGTFAASPQRFAPDTSGLPGTPTLWTDAYQPPAPATGASHSVRFEWRPTLSGGEMTPGDGRTYAIYYRAVFGLSADAQTVEWAAELSSDVVGAAAQPGGLLVATKDGHIHMLTADTGATALSLETGVSASVVVFRGGALAPPATVAGRDISRGEQLSAIARTNDTRLATASQFAVRHMLARPDESTTAQLFAICEDERVGSAVRQVACDGLATREDGGDQVLMALGRRASFLEGTNAPPAGALGAAAARLEDTRAVALLIRHFEDPATSEENVAAVAKALGQLGDTSAAEPLVRFLTLYHADNTGQGRVDTLGEVAAALLHLDQATHRATLEGIRDSRFAASPVRGRMSEILTALDAGRISGNPNLDQRATNNEAGNGEAPAETSGGESQDAALDDELGNYRVGAQ